MKKFSKILSVALILGIGFTSLTNLTIVHAKRSRSGHSNHYVRSHTRKVRTRASNGATYTRMVGVRSHHRSR